MSILEYFKSKGHLNYAHCKWDEIKLAYMENIQSGRKLLLEVLFKFLCRKKTSRTKHKKFDEVKTPEFCASTEEYQLSQPS